MTTRRPPLAQRHRPSSAVYIGGDTSYLASPPDLPDLPEPPSPISSSSTSTSGLPSPPATNSTGSGSTGDPGSIAIRGNMLNGNNLKTFHAAFHNNNDDPEYEHDIDDEDNTARLDQRRHSASENVLALERLKSLTQRNKIALDKLSSYSRISSPAPSNRAASSTRSPPPPTPPSILSSSSNSNSSSSHSSSRPSLRRARTQESGSETERDDEPPASSRPTTPLPPPATRQRLISAPASPQKHLTAASSSSGSSTRSPRRSRASQLSFSRRAPEDDGPSSPEDITRAALAAVASVRRTPTGGGTARYTGARLSPTTSGKRRQPLPREWANTTNGRFSVEPPTSPPQHDTSPNKRHSLAGSTASSSSAFSPQSHGHAHSNSTSSTSTIGSTAQGQRASTVRDLARKHQTRWLSEDISLSSPNGMYDQDQERERRQSLRGGSAESALGAGRSLVGEGLRAAGLARERDRDLFSPQEARTPARVEWAEGTRDREHSRTRQGHGRAATSMADYSSARRRAEEDEYGPESAGGEPRTPALRAYRSSAHILDSRRTGPSMEREDDRQVPSPSPYSSMRRTGNGSGSLSQHEHTRLMSDSLGMFEGYLARLTEGGSSRSANDLARHAQIVVATADRLNTILRNGTAKALEEQIDAEVSDVAGATELAELWRRVGGEYREGLRVSDELVRGVTGFLLDVGRVVRDFTGDGRGSDEGRGSASPDASGRRSQASRTSWDAREGRESALALRPSSVLNTRMEPPRTTTPSSRRLLTPREQRELMQAQQAQATNGLVPSDSQETVQPHKYEPSPTPAPRKQNQGTASRVLPPLSIPKPLPTLPSESTTTTTLRRNQSTGDKPQTLTGNSSQRRKTLTSGTVRASGAGLQPTNTVPTTALTPHTVSSPLTFPSLSRNDSDKSVNRSRTNTVTFSRPSTVALAGLQAQHEREQERERQRTISGTERNSEGEKPELLRKRSSIVSRPRASLEGSGADPGPSHAADRSAAAGLSLLGSGKRERRRTVTDIWPPSGPGS
ncbi:hypothetical protein MIND_00808300 [Mycena indigotica]|uniref:Uncharacterized protein n=1 Tax=Mycena indigotica TaxID=2126181 RepID=A0A8H6SGS6_9AGAR|nr:uncharacterized protein MIND_00808300 [Mycena indigotica]KAF7298612.1 hypothetical protein MIND_00808300 [Mycena indigotica]